MNASDVLVIGGGPAGCAAAITLARAGATVTLLEREASAKAKVCGEFLSVEACEEARALGVDPQALDAAPIDRVRVSWHGAAAECALPFAAASVSRAAFDEALLERARSAGVRIERGVTARGFAGLRVDAERNGQREVFAAANIILASGKAEFAGDRRVGTSGAGALGFKMHVRLSERELAALGSAVELTLIAGGYAGMQRIERGLVALATVVTRETFARAGSWPHLVAIVGAGDARFARRLADAEACWPRPLAVSGVPYGFIYGNAASRASPSSDVALYRTGDQFAVIPSFTGDGIAIALVTGSCAARAILAGESADTFHAAMRLRVARPMRVARVLASAIGSPLGRAAVVWPARIAPALLSLAAARTRVAR